jgi:hypothetical protein
MIQLLAQAAALLHKVVGATPLVGGIRDWTQQAAVNSRAVRRTVILVVLATIAMIFLALWETFSLIQLGRVDVIVGPLIGGIFTFLGGVLAAALSALMNSPKSVEPNQPVDTTNNSTNNQVPPAGK